MPAKIVTVQAEPDPMPVAGQRPGPPFFALIVAGLIVIGAGLRSVASIVGPVFLVITLVITVAPLRDLLVRRRWPSWLASAVSLLTIYALLALILGSVAFAVVRLVEAAAVRDRVRPDLRLPPQPQHSAWLWAGAARGTGLLGPAKQSGRPGSGTAKRHQRRSITAPTRLSQWSSSWPSTPQVCRSASV